MKIVVDTNVLWDAPALDRLASSAMDCVLPSVAFAERCRQWLRDGRDLESLWIVLHRAGLEVEPFSWMNAVAAAERATSDVTWNRHARDAFIAGHVGPDDVLWTKNPKDFLAVGLPKERIVAI